MVKNCSTMQLYSSFPELCEHSYYHKQLWTVTINHWRGCLCPQLPHWTDHLLQGPGQPHWRGPRRLHWFDQTRIIYKTQVTRAPNLVEDSSVTAGSYCCQVPRSGGGMSTHCIMVTSEVWWTMKISLSLSIFFIVSSLPSIGPIIGGVVGVILAVLLIVIIIVLVMLFLRWVSVCVYVWCVVFEFVICYLYHSSDKVNFIA